MADDINRVMTGYIRAEVSAEEAEAIVFETENMNGTRYRLKISGEVENDG